MNSKLKNFLPIYVINLKDQVDRLLSIKNQFKQHGIIDYTIIDAVDARDIDLSKIVEGKIPALKPAEIGCMASHIKAIKTWLSTSSTDFAVIAEDDLSFETVEYWDWTWEDVINKIPNDADIVQLVMIQDRDIRFNMHKKPKYRRTINTAYAWSTGAYIIRRSYAEKIVAEFDVNDKIRFTNKDIPIMVADIALYYLGRAYSMPLFTYILTEDSINSKRIDFHLKSKNVFMSWWKTQAGKYYPEDLFDPNTTLDRIKLKNINTSFKIFHIDGESRSLEKRSSLVHRAKKQLLKHFEELDSPTILIDSLDKAASFYSNNNILINPEGSRGGWKLGELGVWASNFKSWEALANSSFDSTILMEDDIVLEPNFSEKIIDYIDELPKDWDIFSVYIPVTAKIPYRIKKDMVSKYDGNICEIYQSHSCLCYVISKSGAKKLLKLVKSVPVSLPVDTYLFYNDEINAYALKFNVPAICKDFDQAQTLSTIQGHKKIDITGLF